MIGASAPFIMKQIVNKHLTPDEYAPGPLINWSGDIHNTLRLLWSNIEQRNPRFYQMSYKFDRHVADQADLIREFFAQRHVFAVAKDYTDPKVGNRSSLFLMALSERYSKYKTPLHF